jgi:hypothetical protein
VTEAEVKELARRRREAVQAFLDENADLFNFHEGEIEGVEDDPESQLTGPFVLERWILMTMERNLGALDRDFFLSQTVFSLGIGRHELVGMLECAKQEQI